MKETTRKVINQLLKGLIGKLNKLVESDEFNKVPDRFENTLAKLELQIDEVRHTIEESNKIAGNFNSVVKELHSLINKFADPEERKKFINFLDKLDERGALDNGADQTKN